jgi:cytochrome P450
VPEAFTPPTPPLARYSPLGKIRLGDYLTYFKAMSKNPLTAWGPDHYKIRIAPFRFLGRKNVMLNDPDTIHHCFVSNAANYKMNPIRQAVLRPFLRDGLLTAEGSTWKTARHAVAPAFTPRKINAFAPGIRDVTVENAEAIDCLVDGDISASRLMVDMTLDILIGTLFSGDDALDKARFTSNINRLIEITGLPHVFDLLSAPKWIPRIGHGASRRVIADLRHQVGEIAAQRRLTAEAPDDDPDKPADFLDLLLGAGLEEEAVIDNLLTFLAAGHETTARSLSWTLYLLSSAPDVREQLETELENAILDEDDPASWMEHLPWTVAVLKESLRLYPSAPILTRSTLGPDTLAEHDISGNTEIIVSTWLLHRHADLWDAPETFRPSRFFGEAEKDIPRYAYLPFGLGPRVCIGARFAMMEMVIVLAVLLKQFRFDHVGASEPIPVMRITLQPDTDMMMRVSRR